MKLEFKDGLILTSIKVSYKGKSKIINNIVTDREAQKLNPSWASIKGVVCDVRVEDIEETLIPYIKYKRISVSSIYFFLSCHREKCPFSICKRE